MYKKFVILFLLGGLLTIFLKTGISKNSQEYQEKRDNIIQREISTTTIDSIDISGWKVYRNPLHGLEISFPDNWQVEVLPKGIKLINLLSGSKLEVLQVKNGKGLALNDWFREFTIVGGRPTVKAGAELTMLNGRQAYILHSDLEPPNPLFEAYIADDQRRIFVLTATSMDSTDGAILKAILSTFQFIWPE